jgi:hypothetical protein
VFNHAAYENSTLDGASVLEIWHDADVREELVLGQNLGYVDPVAWISDRKRLASRWVDDVVRVWDLDFPSK